MLAAKPTNDRMQPQVGRFRVGQRSTEHKWASDDIAMAEQELDRQKTVERNSGAASETLAAPENGGSTDGGRYAAAEGCNTDPTVRDSCEELKAVGHQCSRCGGFAQRRRRRFKTTTCLCRGDNSAVDAARRGRSRSLGKP